MVYLVTSSLLFVVIISFWIDDVYKKSIVNLIMK